MQNLDLLLIQQVEALVRDHYAELEMTVEDELVAKDVVDVIKYAIAHTKGPFEVEGHLSNICELLGITRGHAEDLEIKKTIIYRHKNNFSNLETLEDIVKTLYYRDEYCMNLLNNLRNNPETATDDIETLYCYFEAYHTGQPMRVLFLNEVYENRGINDHASIVTYVLETYDDKPIN